jgi:Ca2+-dependent lipid-binding protein
LPNEELGKSDPYVVFYFDGEKRKTRVQSKTHTSGGRNPVWEQDFKLVLPQIMNFVLLMLLMIPITLPILVSPISIARITQVL